MSEVIDFTPDELRVDPDYKRYLETPIWKGIARQVRKRENYHCQQCNAKSEFIDGVGNGVILHVHHTTYFDGDFKILYNEQDYIFKRNPTTKRYFLEAICGKCHYKETAIEIQKRREKNEEIEGFWQRHEEEVFRIEDRMLGLPDLVSDDEECCEYCGRQIDDPDSAWKMKDHWFCAEEHFQIGTSRRGTDELD